MSSRSSKSETILFSQSFLNSIYGGIPWSLPLWIFLAIKSVPPTSKTSSSPGTIFSNRWFTIYEERRGVTKIFYRFNVGIILQYYNWIRMNKYKYCHQKIMTEVLLTSSEKFSSTTPSKTLCPSMPLANWFTLSGSSRKILAASKNVSLNFKSLPVLTPLEFHNLMNFKVKGRYI